MATMRDVAKAAGVSTATVSRVLNNSSEVKQILTERVLRTIQELNYQPNLVARSLRTQATSVIALIIADIENPFFTSVCRGVEDVASRSGYSVMVCNADEDFAKERGYIAMLAAQQVAGIIISPASAELTDVSPLQQRGIKVVALDRQLPIATDSVRGDNRAGARAATHHLLASGARRVACITGTHGATTASERLAGYLEALAAAGVKPDPTLQHFADFKEQGGYDATARVLELDDPPDAIFVANNRMTTGALHALADHGIAIPEDVSIVGFDELPWADVVTPSITTVRQPTYDMGTAAARMLIERIAGEDSAPRDIVFEPELNVRSSSVKSRPMRKSIERKASRYSS
jgi:LacI family transcriptional regulator